MTLHPHGRFFLIPVLLVGLVFSGYLSIKTYRSFQVLQSARALDVPEAGSIRAWMTVDYLAQTFSVPPGRLLDGLGLPTGTDPETTLRSLAETAGVDPLAYVQQAQGVLAAFYAQSPPPQQAAPPSWIERLAEAVFSAFLDYGIPVLVGVLFLGALGLPVPAGPLVAVAGGLALQGDMQVSMVLVLGVGVSVLGDLVGYGVGRGMPPAGLDRWGPWVGYTVANRKRLEVLFQKWGGLTVVLTRSLIAHIGAVASVLAGAGRYDLKRFVGYSLAGRLIWTGAYFGLGYAVGSDFEAASGFLSYLSLLLLGLAVTVGAGRLLLRRSGHPPVIHTDLP